MHIRLARGFTQQSGPLKVNPIHLRRIIIITRHFTRQMKNSRNIFACQGNIFTLGYRTLYRLDARIFHPFGNARCHNLEVFFTRLKKLPYDMRAQEPGAARDGDALAVERVGDGEVRHADVYDLWYALEAAPLVVDPTDVGPLFFRDAWLSIASMGWVFDNTLWNASGPIDGARANISGSADGLAAPTGKDTFVGNFHIVDYYGDDFVVPSNWLLLAVRNGDLLSVEWGSGEVVDPGYTSEIYNIGGQKIKKFNVGSSGLLSSNSSSQVAVPHGLGQAPSQVLCTPGGSGASYRISNIGNFTSTSFTVTLRRADDNTLPGSGADVSFYFLAIAE